MLPVSVHLFSSAPRLHTKFQGPFSCNIVDSKFCLFSYIFSKMQLKLQQSGDGTGECPVPLNWAPSAGEAHPNKSRDKKMAAPPLDLPCKRPVTYQGDILNYSGNPLIEETD